MNFNRRKGNVGCLFVISVVLAGCFLITQIYYIPLPTGLPPRQITLITEDLPQNQNPQPSRIQLSLEIGCSSGRCFDLPDAVCVIQTKTYDREESSSLMQELWTQAQLTIDRKPFLFRYPAAGMIGDIYFSYYWCFPLQTILNGEHILTYESSSASGERFVQAWQILIEG